MDQVFAFVRQGFEFKIIF